MAELHDLSPVPGSTKKRKRVGRGPGSGKGTTAGRGQDGQGSRSGGGVRLGFEGGQMPLQRRIPKRGFTNINRVEYQVVNVRDLSRLDAGEVTPEILHERGLIGTLAQPVKILGMGEVEGAYQISAHAFSGSAREKIEAAGGSATLIEPAAPKAEAEEAAPKASAEEAEEPAPEVEAQEEATDDETPEDEKA